MNITELERWSEIPVHVSNEHLVERKLYGADAQSRMVSKADIWESDMVNRNKLIYYQSSTIGHGAPPVAIPIGVNKDFEYGLNPPLNVKSRPAMSAKTIGAIPEVVKKISSDINKQRLSEGEYIMKHTKMNPFVPQRTPW